MSTLGQRGQQHSDALVVAAVATESFLEQQIHFTLRDNVSTLLLLMAVGGGQGHKLDISWRLPETYQRVYHLRSQLGSYCPTGEGYLVNELCAEPHM